MEYFTSEKLSERIIRIRDISNVFSYLVLGDKSACLIDTGCGFGNLREYVDSLTKKDYVVLLTHGHVDHASGASLFTDKKIYMHEADRELLKVHTTFEMRKSYAEMEPAIAAVPICDYNPILSTIPLPLIDQQIFDLGNIHIQAIHAPGHTQGMTMLLIQEERTILFGDGCGVSVLLLDEYASSVSEYVKTLEYIKQYEPMYDKIIRNHGTGVSPKILLDNVIECCYDVMEHKDDHFPATHIPMKCDNAFFARALVENGIKRVDGKEGNLVYRSDKI